MTFLSLAKGDPTARMLLANAIKARYGVRPLMLSSLRLDLQAKTKGMFGLPATRTIRVQYVETTHRRWDELDKLLRFKTAETTESYDGGTIYWRKGGPIVTNSDPEVLQGIRNQIWLEMALFLTPLTEEGVVLKSLDDHTLQASPDSKAVENVTLHLNADHTLKAAEATCYHMAHRSQARLTIRPTDGLRALNGFALPVKLVYTWEGEAETIYTVVDAQANPQIPLTEFSIS